MSAVQTPLPLKLLNKGTLDVDQVFANEQVFNAYLTGPTATPGRIVSVFTGNNEYDVFKINQDLSISLLGSGNSLGGACNWEAGVITDMLAQLTRIENRVTGLIPEHVPVVDELGQELEILGSIIGITL